MACCAEDNKVEEAFEQIIEHINKLSNRMDRLENNIAKLKSEIPTEAFKTVSDDSNDIESINNEIMEQFDFELVANVMNHLDWRWASTKSNIPTIEEIKATAAEMLNHAWSDLDAQEFNAEGWREWIVGTGGLEVWVCEGNEKND